MMSIRRRSWPRFLAPAIPVVAFALVFVVVEVALRELREPRENVEPYALSFYTHDGEKLSVLDGPLRLALDPFTIYRNSPNQETEAFTINRFGFRGRELPWEPGLRGRVILTGGSAAFGYGARNDGEAIPARLQAALSDIQVINAGVVGFLSGQELVYLVTELVDLQPDIVVVYDGWNDLCDTWNGRVREAGEMGYNGNFFLIEEELVRNYQSQHRIGPALLRLSAAFSRQSELVSLIQDWRQGDGSKGRTTDHSRSDRVRLQDTIETYVGNVEKMNDFCRARGIRFLVVIQAELGQKRARVARENDLLAAGIGRGDYARDFPVLYERFRSEAAAELAQGGVAYLDINTEPAFVENSEELFLDVVHANAAGCDLVARLIADRLKNLGWSRGVE